MLELAERFALRKLGMSADSVLQDNTQKSAGYFVSEKEQNLLERFIREEDGQDFAEYALILGAIGVVAIAVIARYRNELIAAFEAGIEALRMARGG